MRKRPCCRWRQLTAWELLSDWLEVTRPVPGAASVVIFIGGGGGVGSMAFQLPRAFTKVTVIATGSRPITKAWCVNLGAHMSSTTADRSSKGGRI